LKNQWDYNSGMFYRRMSLLMPNQYW